MAKYQAKVDRYEKEKTNIMVIAVKLEADAKEWFHTSDRQMHPHYCRARSTTGLHCTGRHRTVDQKAEAGVRQVFGRRCRPASRRPGGFLYLNRRQALN
ncbi:MAG: DUF4337 domain-containing protein [Rhodoferax sp.]|nr:DUF4337 domain-containing protein [Rhodoferax sp.]